MCVCVCVCVCVCACVRVCVINEQSFCSDVHHKIQDTTLRACVPTPARKSGMVLANIVSLTNTYHHRLKTSECILLSA